MSDKILVSNTAIVINDYEFGDCPRLENSFKIYNPVTYSHYYLGIYYDSDNKKLYLPRGVDIWYIEKILGVDATILVNKYYKYHSFSDGKMKCLPRDDTQNETLMFMIGRGKYSANETKSQLAINLLMGKGKTFLTTFTLMFFGIRGIVITSNIGWLEQWRDRVTEYTNLNNKEIYTITGSTSIYRLLRMTESQLNKYKLFLVTHDTLQSYGTSHKWESVGELFRHLQIGIKIYDEAHLNFMNICMIDFFTNVYKTYYLTASPEKSNESEDRIYQLAFKNVPSIELFDEDTDPHTTYIALKYNSKPTPIDISNCKNKYGLDRNKYTDYVVKQENYYKLLSVLIELSFSMASNLNQKVLIYIGTNNAIQITYNWIMNNYPELRGNVGIYTSVIPKNEKKLALNKKIILSTTKSAGAAVDIDGLVLTIVLAEPYKSKVIAKQSLGRTRASGTYYIDVIDQGFEQCKRFYYKKLPIFEKYALECAVMSMTQRELDARYDKILQKRATPPKRNLFEYIENDKPRKMLFTKID